MEYDKHTGTTYSTSTGWFRGDLNWEDLLSEDENTVIHAGSGGEEAYSLAILNKVNGLSGTIISKDFNQKAITHALAGVFNVTDEELSCIENFTHNDIQRFFDIIPKEAKNDYGTCATLKVKDELKEIVSFSCADAVGDLPNLPKEKIRLMCRNFWPFLDSGFAFRYANGLIDRLAPSSSVVIGKFDLVTEVNKLLIRCGFQSTSNPLIFKKPDALRIFV